MVSDRGALAAIEKFGKMVEIFGDLRNSDCPCPAVCEQKRARQVEKMNFPKYLDYSLEEGSYFNYYLDSFKNYDEVLAAVTSHFVADSVIVRVSKLIELILANFDTYNFLNYLCRISM